MGDVDAKICPKCRKPNDSECYMLCDTCREIERIRVAKRRSQFKETGGVCDLCGKPLESTEYKRCEHCRKTSNLNHGRWREKYRKIEGICSVCHKPYESEQYSTCESCREIDGLYHDKWYQLHREDILEQMRVKHHDARLQVLQYYSATEIPQCACCGDQTVEFLSIDHIDGGGGKHRKKVSTNFYKWLIRNDFPDGYRVLCYNCNLSRGFNGYCPHEVEANRDDR